MALGSGGWLGLARSAPRPRRRPSWYRSAPEAELVVVPMVWSSPGLGLATVQITRCALRAGRGGFGSVSVVREWGAGVSAAHVRGSTF